MTISVREAISLCLHCTVLGPWLFIIIKISRLNLSLKSPLCQVTSFFRIQGPGWYLLCSVKKRGVPHFQYRTTNTTFAVQTSGPFFPPELALWILQCCATWGETITEWLSWESSFGSRAGRVSNESCRSCACQSMAWAALRLPRVLVAVSSALITVPS